jgi:hypothetical protein
MGLLLGVEGFLHLADVLVQAACDGLHGLGGLFLQGLLAGLEGLLVLQGERRAGRLDGLLLSRLQLPQRLLVLLAFGGKERFWIGPEGGPFSWYFKPGVEQVYANWDVPAFIDSDAFEVESS